MEKNSGKKTGIGKGDLVKRLNGPDYMDGKAGLVLEMTETGHMVLVLWPGCKPFWTPRMHLGKINENR